MQAKIQFREFRTEDYEGVVALWRRSEGVEVAEGDDRAGISAYLERNPGLSRIALSGSEIVAAALCGHDGRRGLIYHLAVAKGFRGQGIGRSLVRECLEGLRAHGLTRCLILIARDNPDGLEFWPAQGFAEITGAVPFGIDLV